MPSNSKKSSSTSSRKASSGKKESSSSKSHHKSLTTSPSTYATQDRTWKTDTRSWEEIESSNMAFQAQSLAHAQAPTNNSYAQASTSSYAQASKNQGSIPTPYYAPSQATSNTSAQYSYANVEPTPMERWEGENAQQSPYNAVGQYKYLGKKR